MSDERKKDEVTITNSNHSGSEILRGRLMTAASLAEYTSWRAGGEAKLLYKPADIADLAIYLKQLPMTESLLWLGLGSNTLVRDKGFNGAVILTQGNLGQLSLLDNEHVRAEAGVACATMARFCARHHLAGAEFLAGIPGTMGGALRMNAGCFNGETWDHLVSVETIDRQGVIRQRMAKEFVVGYRHVAIANDEWFVAGTFRFARGEKEHSLEQIRQLLQRRADTQPTGEHTCGSVFRNPPNDHAGRLIESCGLKGYQIGGAFVSPKHANFIVNEGSATAAEIEAVIEYVEAAVAATHNIKLIREVHIIGER